MTTNKKSTGWVTLFLIAVAFLTAHLHFLLLPGIFNTWNAQTTDQLFVLRNSWPEFQPAYDPAIVHVDLTNSTKKALRSPYLDRYDFSRVIDNLSAMNTSAQLWDFIFMSPDRSDHDAAMITATARAKNVYFGIAFDLRVPTGTASERPVQSRQTIWNIKRAGNIYNIPLGGTPLTTFNGLTSAAKGIGMLSAQFDPDGVLRRVPMVIRHGDGFVPAMALRVACDYLNVTPAQIEIVPGDHILLKQARRPGGTTLTDIRIPIDARGQMVVNFAGPWERMDHYNMADILQASKDRDELEMWGDELGGKIVVVADVSTGTSDIGSIPGDAAYPLCGVHANIINNILTGAFLRDASPAILIGIEIIMMLMVWQLSIRLSSLLFSLASICLGLVFIGAGTAGFLYAGLLLNFVRPILMLFFGMTAILVYRYIIEERLKMDGLRQRDAIRATFGRYLSNEVVEELLASPEGLELGGATRRVTFLVSDLRGFTALSSVLPPENVIHILNRFLGEMVEVIGRHQGTVDEIQGDGLLIFFGAPLSQGDDEARAIACAVDMQNTLIQLNTKQKEMNLPELGMGIGIHTGDVVVGNIGSEKRAKYAAVGSAINTAFRIESHTVAGQILASADTFNRLEGNVRIGQSIDVHFKGMSDPMRLYEITGIQKHSLIHPAPGDETIAILNPAIQVACQLIEGKQINRTPIDGELQATGMTGGRLALSLPAPIHANLLIRWEFTDGSPAEMYAKVIGSDENGGTTVHVHYTWMPDGVRKKLKDLL